MRAKRKSQLRLVLYSGGQARSNQRLHREVLRLALQRRKEAESALKVSRGEPLTFTYIPYMDEGAELFFLRAMRRYRAMGIQRFFTIDPATPPHASEIELLLKSDVIYLAGGNTYTFLYHLRRSGLLHHLKRYADQGGVLAGLSAGAILMTPSISLAGIPSYDVDENEVGLKGDDQLRALSLVPFEFSPHETHSLQRKKELLEYSNKIQMPLFSMKDGSGLVVEGNSIRVWGEGKLYCQGQIWNLNNRK
jgi:dipeptidase E